MIRKVKFVTIPVKEQDRALDFYVNKLGFSVVTDQPMAPGQRWIELRPSKGDCGVALFTPPGQENRVGSFLGISMECDDVEKTHAELVGVGVQFVEPPKKQPWGVMAIVKDSEGNQLVLSSSK
jgi:predicted enzyme related to lactoylglutathione lyase